MDCRLHTHYSLTHDMGMSMFMLFVSEFSPKNWNLSRRGQNRQLLNPHTRHSTTYQSSTFSAVGIGCPVGPDPVLQLSLGLWPSCIAVSKLFCHMFPMLGTPYPAIPGWKGLFFCRAGLALKKALPDS